MLEIFRELRGLLHVSHVHIDSWVFRLHYSVTTTCMFAFSLIVSAKQYVGNPIDCIHTKDIPEVNSPNHLHYHHRPATFSGHYWKIIQHSLSTHFVLKSEPGILCYFSREKILGIISTLSSVVRQLYRFV